VIAVLVAVVGPERRSLAHGVGFRHASRELTLHRLGDDEADVVQGRH